LIVFVITQTGDVWLYHKWWEFTEKHFGSKRKGLWIRNNGSTLVSQLFNAILYNVLAFAGMYNTSTLISIIVSTYVIYIATSLLDTPVAYLCRRIRERYDVDGFSKGETKQISA
jgi:queuosine precursor transporter